MSESVQEEETFKRIFATEEDAQNVLAAMQSVLNVYSTVSVADFSDLVGETTTYDDTQYVWTTLEEMTVTQTEEGFVLEAPLPEKMVADVLAGAEKAASLAENLAVPTTVIAEELSITLERIESKLDQLLGGIVGTNQAAAEPEEAPAVGGADSPAS